MFASSQGLDDVARAFAAKIQELQELTLLRVDSESPRYHLHSSQSVISQLYAVITGSAEHKWSLGLVAEDVHPPHVLCRRFKGHQQSGAGSP